MVQTVIVFGLIVIPVLLFVGFVFGQYNADRTRRTLRPLRMATSLILVGCVWVIWSAATTLRTTALLIALGMTFGFIGDLILAQVLPMPNRMIFGLIPFAIGHIFYMIAFILVAAVYGLNNPLTGSIAWSLYIIVAALLWVMFINNPRKPRALNVGSLIYAWLISLMAGTAAGLAIQDARFIPTAIGGLLFLISDLILGHRELRDHAWFLVHDVVWVIYITGQALIVLIALYAY
jgi:hypothetical protein